MTTITRFTKEQLIARINNQIDINATIIERLGDDSAAVSELAVKTATMDMKIFDIALEALTAEPVYQVVYDSDTWRDINQTQFADQVNHGSPVRIVYAAPPAPVVPDEKPMPKASNMFAIDAVAAIAEAMGWNACRAAMLQGSQPVSNRDELPVSEIECDICGFKSTDPDGAHYCCEDNSND